MSSTLQQRVRTPCVCQRTIRVHSLVFIMRINVVVVLAVTSFKTLFTVDNSTLCGNCNHNGYTGFYDFIQYFLSINLYFVRCL